MTRRELIGGIEFGPEPAPEPAPVADGQLLLFDEELGTIRLCLVCGEWWPDDGEFFAADGLPCRACQAEVEADQRARRRETTREAARRYRARMAGRVPA